MTPKLLIAGGGTGGHIFPGVAVAQEWQDRGGDVAFVGTERGQEKNLVPKAGFRIHFLKVGQLKGAGWLGKIRTLMSLPLALVSAIRLIRNEKPDVILGIGGYASAALCLVAPLCGVPMAVMDQNVVPGFTNRMLGKIARRVFVSFSKTRDYFSECKVILTGNPIRKGISGTPYPDQSGRLTLFVFGGSQGALALNQVFVRAMAELVDWRDRLEIIHQAGAGDEEMLKNAYAQGGFKATVSRFFDNMDELYARAHLVIARAGAGTVTELAVSGRPAILVPYPFAADDHQKKNAEFFVKREAAWMIEQEDLEPVALAGRIRGLLLDPRELQHRAGNMVRLGMPDAARMIVDELQQLSKVNAVRCKMIQGDSQQALQDRRQTHV